MQLSRDIAIQFVKLGLCNNVTTLALRCHNVAVESLLTLPQRRQLTSAKLSFLMNWKRQYNQLFDTETTLRQRDSIGWELKP